MSSHAGNVAGKQAASGKESDEEDNRLQIDIPEEELVPVKSSSSKSKLNESSANNSEQQMDTSNNDQANESLNMTSEDAASGKKRRTINKGLDGGYWSTLQMSSITDDVKRKRTRTTVDRLEASYLPLIAASESITSQTRRRSAGPNFSDSDTNSRQTLDLDNTSQSSSTGRKRTDSDKVVLFKSRSFLAVRAEEEGSFFLCYTLTNIFDTSKQSKVQWLEEIGSNRYKLGQVDWLDPQSIVCKVHVKRISESKYEVVESDLKKVKELLAQALKNGGIEGEFDDEDETDAEPNSRKSSTSDNVPSSSATAKTETKKPKILIDEYDFFDNEESESDNESKKVKKKKKLSRSDDEITKPSSSVKKKRAIESSEDEEREKSKSKHQDSKQTKSIVSSTGTILSKKIVMEAKKTDNGVIRTPKKTPETNNTHSSNNHSKLDESSKKKVEKKKVTVVDNGDGDTDQLDSEDEKRSKQKSKDKVKNSSSKPAQGATANEASNPLLQAKKKRLVKAMSNRFLQENQKVALLSKDPFFDEKPELGYGANKYVYVSPYVNSKLAITAVNLRDAAWLKKLRDDVKRIASLHVGKSAKNPLTAAHFALRIGFKEGLEVLINDFIEPKTERVQIAETMFQKFSTGQYNQRSLGIPHIRKLTESRGAKEGNAALGKDNETLKFTYDASKQKNTYAFSSRLTAFFTNLLHFALEKGVSVEMFDFVIQKCQSLNESKKWISDHSFVYESTWRALIRGHRQLASHVMQMTPAGHGWNAVHTEVLKADNDAELTCLLRANMCTKKPFTNDAITPIHCACINPNVKYLKTLLSITQDFNIADKRGRRPIHFAAVCEGPTPLEYLISRVSPYELDSMGNTPLHFACQAGRAMNVEILLNFAQKKVEDDSALTTEVLIDNKYGLGAINKPNKRGLLPIHLAVGAGHHDCVRVLTRYECNVEYPLPNSYDKITPLMYACQLGHFKIAKQLIESSNAKVEARDRFQRTALIHSIMNGNCDLVSYLLRLGANPNATDSSGNSCLHYACAYGWHHAVKLLIDAGAQLNVVNDWRLTPFGAAFLKGHTGICELLLELCKDVDVNFRTEDGETLVMLCVSSVSLLNEASIEQLDYILNKLKGDCQLADSKGNNAFHYLAANKPDTNLLIQQLNNYSESIDTSSEEFKNIIKEKLADQESYRIRMANILLSAKCNPNTLNNEEESPLFTAVSRGNLRFAKYLLTNDKTQVRISSKPNSNGQTLLSLLADKFVQYDEEEMFSSRSNEIDKLFNEHRAEFEQMARHRDTLTDLTPFQLATVRLRDHLKDVNNNQKQSQLGENLSRFLLFLYRDCKSDPNELIYEAGKKNDAKQADIESSESDEDDENSQNGSEKSVQLSNENQKYTPPLFNLISNKATSLLEKLVEYMKDTGSSLAKINLLAYDSDGYTLLLRSLLANETDFAVKLIELEYSLNPGKFIGVMASQVSRSLGNSNLGENVLQMAIRSKFQFKFLVRLFELINQAVESSPSLDQRDQLNQLLRHLNTNKQNFIHVLASLTQIVEVDHWPNLRAISDLFKNIANLLQDNHALVDLITTKDKLGRTPFHTCLIESSNLSFAPHANDFAIFFCEKLFQSHNEAYKRAFVESDVFERIPLHYLFYDSNWIDQATFGTSDLYKINVVTLNKLLVTVNRPYLDRSGKVKQIDPVELLSVLLKLTSSNNLLNGRDIWGYTPLHYACLHGSSISSSIMINSGAQALQQANDLNTPLSCSVYHNRENCSLTILNSIKTLSKNGVTSVLNDVYHLHPKEYAAHTDIERSVDELSGNDDIELNGAELKWTANKDADKDLYPIKCIRLYNIIIDNKWEGINWLVLNDLDKFGLNEFDTIQSAISTFQFSLALRLIEKVETRMSLFQTFDLLSSKTSSHSSEVAIQNRTLLHTIARLDTRSLNNNQKEVLGQILGKLIFRADSLPVDDQVKYKRLLVAFLTKPDQLGSQAIHYACFMHNFLFIDFLFDYLSSYPLESMSCTDLLVNHKDAFNQTAYALFFWQLGRSVYSKHIRDKIVGYTKKYIESSDPNRLEQVARAHYPLLEQPGFADRVDSEAGSEIVYDYPPISPMIEYKQMSPLIYAVNRQNFVMSKFLVKDLGLSVNASDHEKLSTMVYAIRTNNLDICKLLLNHDYEVETVKTVAKQKTAGENGKASRMKVLFRNKTGLKANQDDDEIMSDDSIEEEEEAQNSEELQSTVTSQSNSESNDLTLKVTSSIVLNNLDSRSRTIFHHVACSPSYGSFVNCIKIARLLFNAYQSIATERSGHLKIVPLNDFLGRVDSNIKKAGDYALINGNTELFEEFRRTQTTRIQDNSAKPVQTPYQFAVNDLVYQDINKRLGLLVDYKKDSEAFLDQANSKNTNKTGDIKSIFKVDPMSNMSKTGRIIWDDKSNVPFDVILTKTDVSYGMFGIHNFYKMQIITQTFDNSSAPSSSSSSATNGVDKSSSKVFVLFTRWGRIGDQGQCQRTPFPSLSEAKQEFYKIFKQKTGNDFFETVLEKKRPFENKPRRYNLVKLESRSKLKLKDLSFNLFDDSNVGTKRKDLAKNQISLYQKSAFAATSGAGFRDFWLDLLDVDHLKNTIRTHTSLSVDYLPLTQLSDSCIINAYSLLNDKLRPVIERRMELEKVSKKENMNEYMQLLDSINNYSNEFYDLIPQMNYNHEKLKPISNERELNVQMRLLNQLSNAHIACRILMGAKQAYISRGINPFEYVYAALDCRLELLDPSSLEAQYILRYTSPATIESTSNDPPSFSIKQIFKLERSGEQSRFDQHKLQTNHRSLLWHGTSLENVMSIMKNGLKKTPSDASRTNGQRYGEGIYFSDAFQFSLLYTGGVRTTTKQKAVRRVYMLVCEVGLGKMKELRSTWDTLESLPPGHDSVKAFGYLEPSPNGDLYMPNGCIIPLGNLVNTPYQPGEYHHSRTCNFNQFIVYNESQVCLRYMVECEIDA